MRRGRETKGSEVSTGIPTTLSLPLLPRSPRSNGNPAFSRPSEQSVNPLLTSKSAFIRPEGPYITYEMIRRLDEKVPPTQESKKKWLTRKGFTTSIRRKDRFISNYVQATPSEVPVLHHYRDTHREKWLGGAFRPAHYNGKLE